HVAYQPLGVDTAVFSPHRRRHDLRRRLGLSPQVRLLAYAGRFASEKNLPVLLDAFSCLGPGYHLLLLGGAQSHQPMSNVTVRPYCRDNTELAAWLASVDALVHAGTAETFGLVILEAMACGRPVVGVRSGAVPELVDDSVGVLVERAVPSLFAEGIRNLYDRDLEELGHAARERVLSRFTWQQALRSQHAVYVALCGVGAHPEQAMAPRAAQQGTAELPAEA
ncbi:MAG: glycosyltransferase, partial [Casimicrobiaceae bacterium]